MTIYYFEQTDIYCGLNYSYLTRYMVSAKSLHGALCKISKATGLNFRHNGGYYASKSGATGLYEYDITDMAGQDLDDWKSKAIEL